MSRAINAADLSLDERSIARRWAILNAWGWPPDLPKPATEAERLAVAKLEMAKAERAIGHVRCLAYWNSEEWGNLPTPKQEYGYNR